MLVAYGVFAPIANFELLRWDDPVHIMGNPALYPPLSFEKFSFIWRKPYFGMYIPVTYTSWALLKKFGEIPRHFHIINGLFHTANAFLVYLIARQIARRYLAAWIAAAVFLMHPLVVEPVAWISGFKDISSAFWGLLACLIFVASKRPIAKLFALFFYALAILSKPSAIVFAPLAAILAVYCDLEIDRRRAHWLNLLQKLWVSPNTLLKTRFVQAAVATIAALPMVWLATRLQPEIHIAERVAWWQRPLIALDTVAFYFKKFLFPWPLTPDYGRTPSQVLASSWWLNVSIGALVVIVSLNLFWRQKYLGFCLILILTALLPNLGLVTFAFQDQSTVADRYAYPALLGLALASAGLLNTRAGTMIAISTICGLSYLTVRQLPYWQSQKTLFTYMLEQNPQSAVAYDGLGSDAYIKGDWASAESYFRSALALNPKAARPWFNLGTILWLKGSQQEARKALETSLRLAGDIPDTLNNLGLVYFVLGYLSEAESLLRRALTINPFDLDARYNLARVLIKQGAQVEAKQLLQEANEIQPNFLESLSNPSSPPKL